MVNDDGGTITISLRLGQDVATSFLNFPQTLERILTAVTAAQGTILGIEGTILSHGATLNQLVTQGVNIMAILVDLQAQEARVVEDLRRAADMIAQLQQGHTVTDAEAQAVIDALKAAADAFEAAVPAPGPGPGPQPGP